MNTKGNPNVMLHNLSHFAGAVVCKMSNANANSCKCNNRRDASLL